MDMTPIEMVKLQARGYKGVVHGDAPDGGIDVEFPNILEASVFADTMTAPDEMFGPVLLTAEIRKGDAVTSLSDPVTLTVFVNPTFGD